MPTEERRLRRAASAVWRWPGRHPWWIAAAVVAACGWMVVFAVDLEVPFRRQPLPLAPTLASAAWLAYGTVRRWRWPRLLPATVSLAALIVCSLLVQTGWPHRLFFERHRRELEGALRPTEAGPGPRSSWAFPLPSGTYWIVRDDGWQPTGAGEQGRILGDWHWEYH